MAVRRKEVALLAGVSPAVVSYVLNGGPRNVAEETRLRVLAAVEELGYAPNSVARSLRANRTMTLALVVPDTSNPFFAELGRAVEEAAFAAGYTLLIGNATEDEQRQATYVRTFLQRQVDGLVLVPAHGPSSSISLLENSGKPWVVLDRRLPARPDLSQVLVDNRGGARVAAGHLAEHGRTRIACIGGPRDVMPSTDRVAGYQDGLSAAGLDPAPELVRNVAFGRRAGYFAALDLFAPGGPHPDAVFVASDEQAVGVLRALTELGLRCPEDVAVASFDGIAASAYTVPALTTVSQPYARLGTETVERLLVTMSGEPGGASVSELAVELIARGSCGCEDPPGGDHDDPSDTVQADGADGQ